MRTAILLTCGLCCGCVPVYEHYQRVEATDAVYLKSDCGDYGARNVAYYPFHTIFISVNVTGLDFGLHYAAGAEAHLNGDAVTIRGHRQGETIEVIVHVRPVIHAETSAPEEFDAMSDPMDPSGLHAYRRSTKGGGMIWAAFLALDDQTPTHYVHLPEGMVIDTIQLQSITVNGQTYGPQTLPVVRKAYAGVLPLNC